MREGEAISFLLKDLHYLCLLSSTTQSLEKELYVKYFHLLEMRCHAYRLRLNFWLEATTTRTKEDQTRVVGKKKMAEEVEQLNTTRKYVGDTVTSNQSLSHCVTWIQNCDKNLQMISIIYVGNYNKYSFRSMDFSNILVSSYHR